MVNEEFYTSKAVVFPHCTEWNREMGRGFHAQGIPSMQSHKKEELIRKIYAFRDDIMTFLEDNTLHQKDNILLTTKQVEQIEQLNRKLSNLKEMA